MKIGSAKVDAFDLVNAFGQLVGASLKYFELCFVEDIAVLVDIGCYLSVKIQIICQRVSIHNFTSNLIFKCVVVEAVCFFPQLMSVCLQNKILKKHKLTILSRSTRESNRLKYRSGSGSDSRNFIFNGSVPVQV